MRSFKPPETRSTTAASYNIKTSHGLVVPAFPVFFYWEIEMEPDAPDAFQHVLPAVYIDMIFPIEKWIGTDGYDSVRTEPFVSPILHTEVELNVLKPCFLLLFLLLVSVPGISQIKPGFKTPEISTRELTNSLPAMQLLLAITGSNCGNTFLWDS